MRRISWMMLLKDEGRRRLLGFALNVEPRLLLADDSAVVLVEKGKEVM